MSRESHVPLKRARPAGTVESLLDDSDEEVAEAAQALVSRRQLERTLKYYDYTPVFGYITISQTSPQFWNMGMGQGVAQNERIGNSVELVSLELDFKIVPNRYNYNGASQQQMLGVCWMILVVYRHDASWGGSNYALYVDTTVMTNWDNTVRPKNIEWEDRYQVLRKIRGCTVGSAYDVNTMYQTYNPAITGFMPYATCAAVNNAQTTQYIHEFIPSHGRKMRYNTSGNQIEGGLSIIFIGDGIDNILIHEAPELTGYARLRFRDDN